MIFKTILMAALVLGTAYSDVDISPNQINSVINELCDRANVKEEAVISEVKNSGKNFVDCIKQLVDIETIKTEIEEAKPRGALDEVFKKYCNKSPQLKTCIKHLIDSATPCFDQAMKDHTAASINATDQLIDFVCYKDGDRIALFIAEEGPQCFQSKSSEIQECATKLKSSFSSYEDAKKMSTSERCAKFDDLSSCVVKSLEGCDTPTPANMAESLLRFVRKGSPCNTK